MLFIAQKHEVDAAVHHFFPYINMYKKSRLANAGAGHPVTDAFLTAIVINCILDEVEHLFRKKLLNNRGPKLKFELSEAQGILLYQTLKALPLPHDQYHLHLTRQQWLTQLDQQVIRLVEESRTPPREKKVRTKFGVSE